MFKRFISILLLGVAILAFGPKRPCLAAEIESDIRNKTVMVNYVFTAVAGLASTTTLVISLSSTTDTSIITISSQTAWPHHDTGHINITGIRCFIDKLPLSTASIKLGVVTDVNTSSGNASNFFTFLRSSSTVSDNLESVMVTDNQMKNLRVIPGLRTLANGYTEPRGMTPYLVTNDLITSSSLLKSTLLLPSPSAVGLNIPKAGDVIMTVAKDPINPITIYLEVMYHSDIDQ